VDSCRGWETESRPLIFVGHKTQERGQKVSKKQVKIGLFGFGTIGRGVADTLESNGNVIAEKTGVRLSLKEIVDIDENAGTDVPLCGARFGKDAGAILNDDSIKIVVELIGGVGAARDLVAECLKRGKHVVTANKELIAKHGPELEALAREHAVRILFEASVGGGIPILTPLLTCLRANRVHRMLGIVNGTTNYILSEMESKGASFSKSLKEAQKEGYAEADPTNDIEGYDAAYKAVILSAVAFGKFVDVASIHREGILGISSEEMDFARQLGYKIKLLAVLEDGADGVSVRVHPALLPKKHPMASIDGVLNAVYIDADPIGPLMFVGRGAGPAATSSAVIGDIIALATGCVDSEPGSIFKSASLVPKEKISNAFYIRMQVKDRPGVLADISRCFSDLSVSIASVMQSTIEGDRAQILWLTHKTPEDSFEKALEHISGMKSVYKIISILRVFD
jgi:homoserine dehydrogenase